MYMCDQVDLISVHQMYPHIVQSGFRRSNTPIPADVWSQVQGSNVCKPKQCVSTVMRRFVERLMCLNPVKDFTGSEQPLQRVEEEGSVFSSRGRWGGGGWGISLAQQTVCAHDFYVWECVVTVPQANGLTLYFAGCGMLVMSDKWVLSGSLPGFGASLQTDWNTLPNFLFGI